MNTAREGENPKSVSLTRKTTVGQADTLSTIEPNVIPLDASLLEIVESMQRVPLAWTIAVVDQNGQLQGIIPFSQIVDEVLFRLTPEEFLSTVHSLGDAEEFAIQSRLSQAATAAEMMRPPVYVHSEETVIEAFHKIRQAGLRGLPIVDGELRVTGYLDLFELVQIWLKIEKAKVKEKVDK
jgi:CBS domain-containing protein